MKILVLIATVFLSGSSISGQPVRVNLALIDSSNAMETRFLVEIKNLSRDSVKLTTDLNIGVQDYTGHSAGNIIVELQQKRDTGYTLLSPTANINPVFYQHQYRQIAPNQIILETVSLYGRHWGRKGLLKGDYRVRVFFNWDEWGKSKEYPSRWVYFTIE